MPGVCAGQHPQAVQHSETVMTDPRDDHHKLIVVSMLAYRKSKFTDAQRHVTLLSVETCYSLIYAVANSCVARLVLTALQLRS
jgi:hypothetical protein